MTVTETERYKILRLIGKGGFGAAYVGLDQKEQKQVVLKTIRRSREASKYLEREFDILSSLAHPNIVQVFEKFCLNGHLYFAMEKINGAPIFKALPKSTEGSLSNMSAYAFLQLQEALNYLHENSLIHLELSSGNLLVSEQGVLKIIDFEHCRRIGVDETQYWPDGIIVGTPIYMSPEHIQGNPVIESDYFVVGTLLLEYLSGSNPFLKKESMSSILQSILNIDPLYIISLYPQIENSLIEVLVSLLAPEPTGRHRGWELLHELTSTRYKAEQPPSSLNKKVEYRELRIVSSTTKSAEFAPINESQDHLRDLIDTKQKRLRILELQAARYGTDCPAHISLEIEEIREDIRNIKKELNQ